MTQRRRDIVSGFFCMAVGMIFFIGSFKYGALSRIPNAGLFPFLGGMVLIVLSMAMLASTRKKKEDEKIESFFPYQYSMKRLLILTISLFGYGIGLEYLGFAASSFLFMIILLRFIEPQKWITIFIASCLTTVFSYVLFRLLLKVQFPHGILGI